MILVSYHAAMRMKERKINISEIRAALEKPDSKARENNICISKKIRPSGHLLIVVYKVVYTDYGQYELIITVITTSKITKYFK